jgi:hypothetical protein
MRAFLLLLGAAATVAWLVLGFAATARLCRTAGGLSAAIPDAPEAQLCPAVGEAEPVASHP